MRLTTLGCAAALAVATMTATSAAAAVEAPRRTTTTTVYGDDACPTASNGDIIVCGRLPEDERYRIPKKIREAQAKKKERVEQNWASRNATLDDLARAERPNSCSVVGGGGQTGCSEAMLRQWADERRAEGKQVGIPF